MPETRFSRKQRDLPERKRTCESRVESRNGPKAGNRSPLAANRRYEFVMGSFTFGLADGV